MAYNNKITITPDNEEEEKNDQDTPKEYTQWLKKGETIFIPSGEIETCEKVPPGIYTILSSREMGFYLKQKTVNLDELFELPQPEQALILDDIRKFWTRKEAFKKYKYAYKRGILLYGKPGNGKTSILNLLSQEIVQKHDGLVFSLSSSAELDYFTTFIPQYLRQIEPNTPILCILEDLETLTHHSETETLLLNTLDGAEQMDNIVYMGCTNYPELLKDRILNRPNRFDRRYYLGPPNSEVRKFYFEKKLKEEDLQVIDLNNWVKCTEGLSLAHLGEVVKSVCVLGNTFEETIATLEKMKEKISSHDFEKDTKAIGFSSFKNGQVSGSTDAEVTQKTRY